jgi:hypothetical protein
MPRARTSEAAGSIPSPLPIVACSETGQHGIAMAEPSREEINPVQAETKKWTGVCGFSPAKEVGKDASPDVGIQIHFARPSRIALDPGRRTGNPSGGDGLDCHYLPRLGLGERSNRSACDVLV